MACRVEVSPRAVADLDAITEYIKNHGSLERAEKWFDEMIDAIASLREMPCRCPIADESKDLGQEVRFLLHGRRSHVYKVYFSVRPETQASGTVQVLHVRHWAGRRLTADELAQIAQETQLGHGRTER